MHKNIFIFASIFTTFAHGMEKEIETISLVESTPTSLCLKYHKTKINLIKGSWEGATDTIEFTIVGNQQQRMLEENSNYLCKIGRTYYSLYCNHGIHKRKKDDESASDDDTYKPYRQIDTQTWNDKKPIKMNILTIEEPRIGIQSFYNPNKMTNATTPSNYLDLFVYYVYRPVPGCENDIYQHLDLCFKGDQAIIEASNDLFKCYTKALKDAYGSSNTIKIET